MDVNIETYYVERELLPIKVKKIYSYDYSKYKKPSVLSFKGTMLTIFGGVLAIIIGIVLSILLPIPVIIPILIGFAVGCYLIYYAIMYERYDFVASLCSFVIDENNNIFYIENISNQNIGANNLNTLFRVAGLDAGQLVGSTIAFKNINNGQELMKHTELYEAILNSQCLPNLVVRKINDASYIKETKSYAVINLKNEVIDYTRNYETNQIEKKKNVSDYKLALSKKYNNYDELISILKSRS